MAQEASMNDDKLDAAKGIMLGLLLSSVFWVIAILSIDFFIFAVVFLLLLVAFYIVQELSQRLANWLSWRRRNRIWQNRIY